MKKLKDPYRIYGIDSLDSACLDQFHMNQPKSPAYLKRDHTELDRGQCCDRTGSPGWMIYRLFK